MSDFVSFDTDSGEQFVSSLQGLHSSFEQSVRVAELQGDLSLYLNTSTLFLRRYLTEVEADYSFVHAVVGGFGAELADLNERIADWPGTDNDPILDQMIRRRAAILAQLDGAEVLSIWDQQSGAETLLGWMEESGSEGFTHSEFAALANDPNVPAHVRDAASLFAGEPVMISNLRHTGWLAGSSEGVTVESMELFVATQQASRALGDRTTYDAFDSALNGELDNQISWVDVHRLADDPNADPELRELAQLIEDNPQIFDMLRTGTTASPNEQYIPPNHDGMISFGDVAATAVNMQAFEGRPDAAADFVLGLESTNDHRDASGNFLHIQWFSNAGVRSLASEALSTAPLLSDQVALVERLPESPGGIRNLAITEYYRRMGTDINLILNPDGNGGALTVDSQGSTGTNWFMQGAFASASIRPVLVEDAGYFVINAGWAARQSMADGNQLLFGSLGPAAAAFIENFPPGSEPTQAEIEAFLSSERPPNGVPLFDEGDRQLRDAFLLMLDASTNPDPVTRQQTAFQASLLIGVHEQALVDPFVDRALDQGWDDGFRVLGDVFDSNEAIATGQIDPNLGGYQFDADKPLPVRHSHPDHVIGQDLTTTLNPTLVTTATIGDITYDLSGSGDRDVDLAPLAGWDDVPDHWEVDSKTIDPAAWFDEHGLVAAYSDDYHMEYEPGSSTGVPLPGNDSLPGAAVDDWKDYGDRMWTITNSFQQTHTLPGMEGTPGHGFDEADLNFLPGAD